MSKNTFKTSAIQFVNSEINIGLEKTSDGKQTITTNVGKIPLDLVNLLSEAHEKIINHLKNGG